jgi:hypothetical protein
MNGMESECINGYNIFTKFYNKKLLGIFVIFSGWDGETIIQNHVTYDNYKSM